MAGHTAFKAALVLGAAVLIYVPVMNGQFIWDDDQMVTANPVVRAPDGLYRMWFDTPLVDYFPLTTTTLWLEYRLWGANAAGYHVTNIVLHALNAILLWRVLLALNVPGAWFAALLFAVHPLNAASVAWISERKNTLAQLFFLLTVSTWLRFERTSSLRWYAGALLCHFAALLSKTSVVMLPVVLLICAWWQRGRITARDVVRTLPFFAASLAMGLVTIWFQNGRAIANDVIPIGGPLERLAGACFAAGFYLYSTLLPLNLMAIYPAWHKTLPLAVQLAIGAPFALAFAAAWRHRATWGKAVICALGYFLVTLLPVLGFLRMSYMQLTLVADHFTYLPIVGVIALVAGAGTVGYEKAPSAWRPIWIGGAVVLIGLLSALTWERAAIHYSEETLWRATLEKNPDTWQGHNHYGAALYGKGEIAQATLHFMRAAELNPDASDVHNNLALAMLAQGQVDDAISEYREALRLAPDDATILANLGIALMHRGSVDEAIADFEAALRLQPDLEIARDSLPVALEARRAR